MKLFYSPGACSLSPRIALLEAGIPFTLSKVDLKNKKVESGEDFNGVNGKGYVPALQFDDGQILTEGPAIVQYIADQKPATGLAPAIGTIERYKLQEWLNFISSEIHKPMGSMFNPAQTADWKEAVKATLSKRLDWLSKQLEGKQYSWVKSSALPTAICLQSLDGRKLSVSTSANGQSFSNTSRVLASGRRFSRR